MRLKDLSLNIHYGYTASADSIGTHKLLRITDIQNNKVNWNSVPFCTLSENDAKNYSLKNGDIVIARTGGTIGKSFLIGNLDTPAVFASYLIRIVLNGKINVKYLNYYLDSPLYWEQLKSYTMGTGQPNVNSVSLSSLLVTLPPLNEQHRIVAKIEELLPFIEQYDQKEQQLTALNKNFPEQLKKSILQAAIQGKLTEQLPTDEPASELLKRIQAEKTRLISEKKVKKPKHSYEIIIRDNLAYEIKDGVERCIADEIPFDIPESWCWVRLESIIIQNIGGGTPLKNISKYWNGDIPWASVKDLDKDSIYLNKTIDFISELGLINSSSNIVLKNNIILCTRMGLGKIAINSIDVAINQDLRGIILPKGIHKKFFIYFFKTLKLQGQGLTVKGLPIDELNQILFPLPSIEEQKRIVEKVELLLSSINYL